MRRWNRLVGLLAAGTLMVGVSAGAQEIVVEDAVQIERDGVALRDHLGPDPIDPDIVDTALVFSNKGLAGTRVDCRAFDRNGNPVGGAWLHVPPLGLRYVLASDFSDDVDFTGTAQCITHARINGSAVLIAPGGLTNLDVDKGEGQRGIRIAFPIVAHY